MCGWDYKEFEGRWYVLNKIRSLVNKLWQSNWVCLFLVVVNNDDQKTKQSIKIKKIKWFFQWISILDFRWIGPDEDEGRWDDSGNWHSDDGEGSYDGSYDY